MRKIQSNIYISGVFLCYLFCSFFAWAGNSSIVLPLPTQHTTAINLLLNNEPLVDFTSSSTTRRIKQLEAEIEYLFNEVLTPEGRKQFYSPLPYMIIPELSLTIIEMHCDEKEYNHLMKLAWANEDSILHLKIEKTNIKALDALNEKYHAELMFVGDGTLSLFFDSIQNPYVIANEYKKTLPFVTYSHPKEVEAQKGRHTLLKREVLPNGDDIRYYFYTIKKASRKNSAHCIEYVIDSKTHKIQKIKETGQPIHKSYFKSCFNQLKTNP